MSFAASLASLLTAAATLMNTGFDTLKPNMDIDGTLFLINRQYRVSSAFIPEVRAANVAGKVREMRDDAATALEALFAACKEEAKVNLATVSGYRSYATQKSLYSRKLQRVNGSYARADEYVARAGASEHQLGLAMDVAQQSKNTGLTSSFGRTKGGKWVAENCHRFGFILRYQEGWEDITGYSYEAWHIRYVGVEAATAMHVGRLPMETYMDDAMTDMMLYILESND